MGKLSHSAGQTRALADHTPCRTPKGNGLLELVCFGPSSQLLYPCIHHPHWATLGRARPQVRWLSAAEATLKGQLEALC